MTAASLARSALTGLIIGLTAIVFSVSFAAIIYKGDLAPFLSRGIGLTLIGAAIMAAVGAFVMSYRGTIVQPQDVTALILALSAATIAADWQGASPDALFATVATLVATATAVAGMVSYIIGRARFGFIARFVPYPVLGGFLAATGYLLTMGALGMILRENVTLANLGILFEPDNLRLWTPWAAVGALLCLINRRARNGLVLPASILVFAAGFYVALAIPGIDLTEAQALGLLLGPFDDAPLYAGLGPSIVVDADWLLVLRQLPAIVAVAGMTVVGALLYASALELATGETIDSNKDLRGVGLSNMLAALGGGMVGYHLLSQTLFARSLGVTSRVAGLAVAAVTVATIAFGATYLSVLPIGIFAAVILFLGLDLLITWLWTERRRLPRGDFALILLILAAAATVGFLEAIALGILAACFQFVLAYARTDIVTLRTTAATLRSRTERNAADLAHLSASGDRVLVYALSGHLFFGTAHRLQSELTERITASGARPGVVLLDFRRVTGIDASACFRCSGWMPPAGAAASASCSAMSRHRSTTGSPGSMGAKPASCSARPWTRPCARSRKACLPTARLWPSRNTRPT